MGRSAQMPRPKTENEVQLTFMASEDVRERLDGLAKRMSEATGLGATRAAALRVVVEEGLKALEAKYPPRKR